MDGVRRRAVQRECRDDDANDASDGGPAAGARAARHAGTAHRLAQLAQTIEVDIVPRLVLAHAPAVTDTRRPHLHEWAVEARDEVATFAALVLANEVPAVLSHVAGMRARGVALETIYLGLLAPAARHLGDLWNADLCDFTEVTIGLWRLQQVVRELSPAFQNDTEYRAEERSALLTPMPGEQHTFGILMVAEFFRRGGWDVWAAVPASASELLSIVRSEWFAVIGISVSSEAKVDGLASTIHALRRASRNRAVGVMVGGPIFIEHPELVALVGADATGVDGQQACDQAESMLALLARRS